MAFGRYSRIDDRKPESNYWSTVLVVGFVGLCLVGTWMMTSSYVDHVQTNIPIGVTKDDVREQVSESNGNNNRKQYDNPGDLSQEAIKGDNTVSVTQTEDKPSNQENPIENDKVENLEDKSESGNNKPEDASRKETENVDAETKYVDTKASEGESKIEGLADSNENKQKSDLNNISNKSDSTESINKSDSMKGKKSDSIDTINKSDSTEDDKKSDSYDKKSDLDEYEKKAEDNSAGTKDGDKVYGQVENEQTYQDESIQNYNSERKDDIESTKQVPSNEKDQEESKQNTSKKTDYDESTKQVPWEQKDQELKQSSGEKKDGSESTKQIRTDVFFPAAQTELLSETMVQNGSWSTQSAVSKNEKEIQQSSQSKQQTVQNWKLCNVTSGQDYIPCLDNIQAIKKLRTTKHYEHRERHCPEVSPTCLVSLPESYKRPIQWPNSRDKIWYSNVPHIKLAEFKGHQNWVKVNGEHLTFPGGGTQFKNGALHYIEFIEQTVPDIAWGKRSRVVLDVGCGVASFGGYLFEKDVITMSFAPKDEHEAQIQFALERGIPAISAVMGTKRLPFPGRVFDVVHCARCRVPWHIEGGKLLLELNRILRPGGFFVWSATPVYQKLDEDVEIWNAMQELTKSICWELVAVNSDKLNEVGAAVYKKPTSNECNEQRLKGEPPFCKDSDDPNAAWNVSLQSCMHKVPVSTSERGSQWPDEWPARLQKSPYWLTSAKVGVYGKPAPEDFTLDYTHWKRVVTKSYLNGFGINWSTVRNVMDMRSVYGGFAAALRDVNVWVMNVVSIDSPDTLPLIYERGLFGIYHDWCQSFSTYPRSYDLLHADYLFSTVKKKCNMIALVAEVDRILRPGGKIIIRDNVGMISEIENLLKSMQWEIRLSFTKDKEGILCVRKTKWRPTEVETIA